MRLTLLVPELIWPEPADPHALGQLALPGLEWLLARSTLRRQPAQAFETALAARCGRHDAALAPLRLLGESTEPPAGDAHWLCADPVHLRFHHERIVLADAGAFELTQAEAQTLCAALNAEFADIGQFHAADARRWYLRLAEPLPAALHTAPISAIAGKRLAPDTAGQNNPLTRWLNEVQIFLHNHPLNAARQAAGHPTINSLWLWGEGRPPSASSSPFTALYGAHPLARGLARAAGLPAQPLPDSFSQLPGELTEALVVLDHLLPPVLYEDAEGWRKAAAMLEQHWFAPLRQALGRVDELRILAPTLYGQLEWTLTPADRWKIWRKPRPLVALANELAQTPTQNRAEGNPA